MRMQHSIVRVLTVATLPAAIKEEKGKGEVARTGIGTVTRETALPVISTGAGTRHEAGGTRQADESERVINARLKQHNLVPGLWPKHKQCP